jgi:hypothetical protein
MRGLQAAVILMGVLIVVGVGVVGLTIVRRLSAPAPGAVALVLDEPAGTRMAGTASAGDRLAVLLQGGGPDRMVLIDPRTGAVAGRVGLAR